MYRAARSINKSRARGWEVAGDVNGSIIMKENSLEIEYRIFLIDERPFCVWDTKFDSIVLEFLDSLEPEYYEYIANRLIKGALSKYKKISKYSSLGLRTTYSQALETLFALISSAIQAPNCPHAWFATYRNSDLVNVVRKIHNRGALSTQLKNGNATWENITEALFTPLVLDNKEKEATIKNGFASLWSRFATDFLDNGFTDEYNSIKHGLRIRNSGFSIAIGKEETPGLRALKEKMQLLGKSEFGSSYVISERYKQHPRHMQIKRQYRNWNPEDFGWGLHMISVSIKNIISALKILNGIEPKKVKFHWFNDFSVLTKPWERRKTIGVTSMSGFNLEIPEEFINPFSEKKIIELYNQGQFAGIRRIKFHPSDKSS